MTDAENTIIFSKRRSVITSDPGGRVAEAAFRACKVDHTTELEKKNGVYTFDLWIPEEGGIKQEGNQGRNENNYHNIGHVSDFTWLDDDVF